MVDIPASRFLRPVGNSAVLERLRLQRITSAMETAARRRRLFHLWWHPHNFGVDLQRSEEHTSELQSPCNLVCRLLLEKKNKWCAFSCSPFWFSRAFMCTPLSKRRPTVRIPSILPAIRLPTHMCENRAAADRRTRYHC